ncbi:MAG: CopD family protein [Weeksellaceae bacterium]|nr:CopD family protein [Weeksellaceae bacterium]
MTYQIIEAIHIIFVVSYFAGLFYIVRLFVYHTEALDMEEPKRTILHEQYSLMERRLWSIITLPALIILVSCGLYMLYATGWGFLKQGWMHIKLLFVVFLLAYHFGAWRIMRSLRKAVKPTNSFRLRLLNEVATMILFVIVFAVVLKDMIFSYWYWILISFVALGMLIMLIVRLVNKPTKH